MKVGERQGPVGAGTVTLVLLVTNESSIACGVHGYPVVRLLDTAGASAGDALDSSHGPLAQSESAGAPAGLTLAPGETASALLGGTDMPPGTATTCPSYSFAVEVPGSSTSTRFSGPVPGCGRVVVGPFVQGFNGEAPTGEIRGTAPRCSGSSASRSGLGENVQVTVLSGSRVTGAVSVVAGPVSHRGYDLVLAPGHYRVTSHGGSARRVVVRVGRVTELGAFGRCMPVPEQPPTTVPSRGSDAGPSATTSTTTTTTTAASVPVTPECTNDQIRIAALGFGQAGGSASQVITFQNVGATPCSLTGYPGVAVLNESGEQIEQAVRVRIAMMGGQFEGIRLATIDLGPGQQASATIEGSDNPVAPETVCPYYPALLVTAPDQTRAVELPGVGLQGPEFAQTGFPGCTRIVVTPVVAGVTGSYP